MPTSQQIENALKRVHDQRSFFHDLLATTLEWPLVDAQAVDDIAYGWSQSDLNAAGLERRLVEGSIWQIQPSAAGQPWGVFVLQFKDESSLSPRRGLAGVLRTVLKGLVGSRRKDAGLPSWKRQHLLFICTHDWKSFRFAYYRSKPDEPRSAKLTTFGWSPDTSNRTVVEFNLPALVWPEDATDAQGWVSAWAKAFDKEPLTKDFFRRFDNALEVIKADLQTYQSLSSADAYTQSQLLLERLIFLYFLQNRGWLNQEHRYLASRLSQHTGNPDGFTYYHDFLDKLFWTLSTAAPGAGRLPGVPFLNGGLFDDDEFRQPASLRNTTPPLRVRNRSMKFVFQELLEAFNFTVTEDTPLHQEVAVDPEMLGKVFESIILHAEAADPDAIAPDKRKATGSYYTPRIVVHFICQEVLYQYLVSHLPGNAWGPRLKVLFSIDPTEGIDEEDKQLLRRTVSPEQAVQVREMVLPLKCCDPAVGSGAFPVGLMHELANLRRILETVANGYKDPVVGQGSEWLHQAKAQIVENCLFGVDIQQQAIEICRLRLWLSLIVDYDLGLDPFTAEKSQFSRAIERISQLPNLEMNFRRGDSLHDHISGVPVVILPERASRHTSEFAAISKLGKELHKAKKADRKKNLRLDILEKRLNLSRNIVGEELREIRTRDSSLNSLFGIEESNAKKRERNEREIENLTRALAKVESDQKELEKLRRREADSQFYPKLRKLEGADFDSPFNFAWRIDFPGIFTENNDGFDIIVGNPPFVTARNPDKRELWRKRWPQVCVGTYQLVCPFFELAFGLLHSSGELGFIVSNGFAKRNFGKPLIERFLSTVEVQKIVDCSGLLFPGHGTPTCLLFGGARNPRPELPIRIAAILPGGGDLRSIPEDSPLWHTLAAHHDEPGFANSAVVVSDRERSELGKWPWTFDSSTAPTLRLLSAESIPLLRFLNSYGSLFDTHKDDVFMPPPELIRRFHIETERIARFAVGDQIRNWQLLDSGFVLKPYDEKWNLLEEDNSRLFEYLRIFRRELGSRAVFSGGTYEGTGEPWYRYHQLSVAKILSPRKIVYPEIATHCHFLIQEGAILFTQTAPLILLQLNREYNNFAISALLNSSAALFQLKQTSFNKGAGEKEQRDRFEFAGAKVQQLYIPEHLSQALGGSTTRSTTALASLAKGAQQISAVLSSASLRKLFGKVDEAYENWWTSLPGSLPRHHEIDDFGTESELRVALYRIKAIRQEAVQRLIAIQEEIDWLVYSAYGLFAGNEVGNAEPDPEPLDRDLRPFRIWEQAESDFDIAVSLIPSNWKSGRRKDWEKRLALIRDNEHIRRIEQPVYKRRWDEQWKIGAEWRSGEIAYAAEFIEAFEWWIKERAEWWLQYRKGGASVELGEWTQALWKDERIQASWPVAAEQYAVLEYEKAREEAEEKDRPLPMRQKVSAEFASFARAFKKTVEEETVPGGFPFGVDFDALAKNLKKEIPAKLKKVRGKLNVPRERFHTVGPGQYKWAGLQFKTTPHRAVVSVVRSNVS